MKLDEKRRVVEVLLCSASTFKWGSDLYAITLVNAADSFADMGDPKREQLFAPACAMRREIAFELHVHGGSRGDDSAYAHTALEAAYRLIESSPTLRREFFGASP